MNYVSYNELIKDSQEFAKKLDRNYDLIIGIPRSGLIPAAIIGFHFNLPICTPNEFASGNYQQSIRKQGKSIKRVLLIDDSIGSGGTMNKATELIQGVEIVKAAIYTDTNRDILFYKEIKHPRVFEWNILNHGHLKTACLDFDGVLCKEADFIESDPAQMREFILNAEPLYIPHLPVFAIVTNRIETYRTECEIWLKKHNVKYKHLIMFPAKTAEERRKYLHEKGENGYFKAEQMIKLSAKWFIESSFQQAKEIKELTQMPVFCTDIKQFV